MQVDTFYCDVCGKLLVIGQTDYQIPETGEIVCLDCFTEHNEAERGSTDVFMSKYMMA